MSKAPLVNCSILISRKDLLDTLRQIKKTKGLGGQPAIATFEEHYLCFDFGGCRFRIPGNGTWQGQVTFGSESLKHLAQAPLKFEDSVEVSCDGKSLRIGGWVVPCEWSGLFSPRITLPLGSSIMDILSLRKLYSSDDIERSGLEATLADAEAKVGKLLAQATATLSPLKIDESDLRRLVEQKILELVEKQRNAGHA